jgi:hypothetical protein
MTAPLFTYTLVNFSHEPTSFSREFEKNKNKKKKKIRNISRLGANITTFHPTTPKLQEMTNLLFCFPIFSNIYKASFSAQKFNCEHLILIQVGQAQVTKSSILNLAWNKLMKGTSFSNVSRSRLVQWQSELLSTTVTKYATAAGLPIVRHQSQLYRRIK